MQKSMDGFVHWLNARPDIILIGHMLLRITASTGRIFISVCLTVKSIEQILKGTANSSLEQALRVICFIR